MTEQEIKNIWNSSGQTTQISIESASLVDQLNTRMNSFQKTIRNRDTREISASVIGILIFGYLLYEIPFPITKLASALSIIWFVFIILKFRNSKSQNTLPNLSVSAADQLAHQEETMQHQADLIHSAGYWYSLPSFITNFIFLFGLGDPADYNWTNSIAEGVLPLSMSFKIFTITVLGLFYAFTVWINKRAIKNEVQPILERIINMRQQIKNE